MSRLKSTLKRLPPRLSMDEYAEFVEASLRECDPSRAARQKKLEKRIRTPFADKKLLLPCS
jgi:hypothetical protein